MYVCSRACAYHIYIYIYMHTYIYVYSAKIAIFFLKRCINIISNTADANLYDFYKRKSTSCICTRRARYTYRNHCSNLTIILRDAIWESYIYHFCNSLYRLTLNKTSKAAPPTNCNGIHVAIRGIPFTSSKNTESVPMPWRHHKINCSWENLRCGKLLEFVLCIDIYIYIMSWRWDFCFQHHLHTL